VLGRVGNRSESRRDDRRSHTRSLAQAGGDLNGEVPQRLKPRPFKAYCHCGKPIRGRDTAAKGPYYPANASRNMADNSSALSTGGRQAKFVHTIATDGFAFNAGRLGMVSASTGGKF
jgi:hypothetical protein